MMGMMSLFVYVVLLYSLLLSRTSVKMVGAVRYSNDIEGTVDVEVSVPPVSPLASPEQKHLRYKLSADMLKGAMAPETNTVKFDMKTSAQPNADLVLVNAKPAEDEPKAGPFGEARPIDTAYMAHHSVGEIPGIRMPGTERLHDLTKGSQ